MQDDDGLWRGEDTLVLEVVEDDLTHAGSSSYSMPMVHPHGGALHAVVDDAVAARVLLGMKAALLSGVSTSVWKRRTARTVPSVPCDEMRVAELEGAW